MDTKVTVNHQIVKGAANYLLFSLNIHAIDGHTMTAAEQLAEFGPCQAVAYAPTKRALVALCAENGLQLVK